MTGRHHDEDGDGRADQGPRPGPDDIALGPDPDTDPGPDETKADVAEAQRLLATAGDEWDGRGDDER